jgi:anti-sigma-K factor RskA
MNTLNHISQDDLLLFALQFLPEEQMIAAQQHMLDCEDCRRQVSWIQADLVSYAITAEMHDPPVGARERLMRSIAKDKANEKRVVQMPLTPATSATQVETTPNHGKVFSIEDAPARRGMGFGGWAGWAVAAAAIAAAGLQYQQNKATGSQLAELQGKYTQSVAEAAKASVVFDTLTDASAKQVSLRLPASKEPTAIPEGHASYLQKKGSVVFVANNLSQLQANTTYELWLIPTGAGAKPIPAGTFKPDSAGRASVVTAGLPAGVVAAAFGVTIEPEGGSASPTLPIVLVGA